MLKLKSFLALVWTMLLIIVTSPISILLMSTRKNVGAFIAFLSRFGRATAIYVWTVVLIVLAGIALDQCYPLWTFGILVLSLLVVLFEEKVWFARR